VAGAVIGSAVGAAAAKALESQEVEDAAVDDELDEAIGVTSPDLGAARAPMPPTTRGAISAPSAGAGGRDVPPTEGDIPPAEREDT
jgi:hypothetical protein